MKTIMISPTKKAGQRTKNRIREHGPKFEVDSVGWEGLKDTQWLLASGKWLGWLPRDEFHVECVGEKFIEKALDKRS